jgi:phenylalanyl-tRNA synthetase beta subunit
MNFQFYVEKLHDSEEFKKFIKENSEAYFCSAFFTKDEEGKDNKIHVDYFIKEKADKIFSFEIENNCKKIEVETYDGKIPEKLEADVDFDIDEVEKLIREKIEEEKIKEKFQRMMFSLQKLDGKDFLVGTVFVSMLGMLKINIDIKEMKITFFEKKSLFDMVKVIKKKDKKDVKEKN